MKKWILIFLLFIIVIAIGIYFFIPANRVLNYQTMVSCTEDGAGRIMLDKNKLDLWWPGIKKDDTTYSYKNCNYRIDKILVSGIEMTVFNDTYSTTGNLEIIAAGADSAQLLWTSSFEFSNNLIKKISQYNHYNNIKKSIESFIKDTKKYFEKEENIYGMKVVKQKVTEASLISVKQSFDHYPSTQEIYGMINSLREYIKQKGGEENNYPMLNVHTEDSTIYETMAAIPTKNDLPSEGKFLLKKMVLGNILMAEVKGGLSAIINGEQQLKNYVSDHKKTAPAIPFQSLVTNRLQVADSSKWVTKLYYPIFY